MTAVGVKSRTILDGNFCLDDTYYFERIQERGKFLENKLLWVW